MAKATVPAPARPPVTLELTGDEAAAIFSLLCDEVWPTEAQQLTLLNEIFSALCSTDVVGYDG